MKINYYELTNNLEDLVQLREIEKLPKSIQNNLLIIEKEIVSEYLKKQENKVGITKLGNSIKYNKTLNQLFSKKLQNTVIIKATENRRSFIKLFVDSNVDYPDSDLYFFILEKNFGKSSRIVDATFIKIENIKYDLERFFTSFKSLNKKNRVYFIEMKGFDDFFIESIDEYKIKYSKLHKK